jgi:Tfp pilus assembly protein PilO
MARFDSKEILAFVRLHPGWVGCIVASVLAASASGFLLWRDIPELNALYQERAKDDQVLLTTLASGPTLRQELTQVREATRQIEENLVIETNLAVNHLYFYSREEQTRSRLTEMHPLSSSPPAASSPYRSIPYSLKVTGTFEQTAAFLQSLETGPRLLKVVSFSFRRREPGGSTILLDLTVELLGKK